MVKTCIDCFLRLSRPIFLWELVQLMNKMMMKTISLLLQTFHATFAHFHCAPLREKITFFSENES